MPLFLSIFGPSSPFSLLYGECVARFFLPEGKHFRLRDRFGEFNYYAVEAREIFSNSVVIETGVLRVAASSVCSSVLLC